MASLGAADPLVGALLSLADSVLALDTKLSGFMVATDARLGLVEGRLGRLEALQLMRPPTADGHHQPSSPAAHQFLPLGPASSGLTGGDPILSYHTDNSNINQTNFIPHEGSGPGRDTHRSQGGDAVQVTEFAASDLRSPVAQEVMARPVADGGVAESELRGRVGKADSGTPLQGGARHDRSSSTPQSPTSRQWKELLAKVDESFGFPKPNSGQQHHVTRGAAAVDGGSGNTCDTASRPSPLPPRLARAHARPDSLGLASDIEVIERRIAFIHADRRRRASSAPAPSSSLPPRGGVRAEGSTVLLSSARKALPRRAGGGRPPLGAAAVSTGRSAPERAVPRRRSASVATSTSTRVRRWVDGNGSVASSEGGALNLEGAAPIVVSDCGRQQVRSVRRGDAGRVRACSGAGSQCAPDGGSAASSERDLSLGAASPLHHDYHQHALNTTTVYSSTCAQSQPSSAQSSSSSLGLDGNGVSDESPDRLNHDDVQKDTLNYPQYVSRGAARRGEEKVEEEHMSNAMPVPSIFSHPRKQYRIHHHHGGVSGQ